MDDIPDSINPSLYRNTLYNTYAGLFEVCDGCDRRAGRRPDMQPQHHGYRREVLPEEEVGSTAKVDFFFTVGIIPKYLSYNVVFIEVSCRSAIHKDFSGGP